MDSTMTKMPDGSFVVDEETMVIEREDKAPFRPLLKVKEGEPAFTPAAHQANSTATDAAGVVADFNALLAKLIAAGIMKAE